MGEPGAGLDLLAGDECFGVGTSWLKRNRVLSLLWIFSLEGQSSLLGLVREEERGRLLEESQADLDAILKEQSDLKPLDAIDAIYMNQRVTCMINPKRKLSSHYGIMIRNPWLDHDVMDYMRIQPAKYRKDKCRKS